MKTADKKTILMDEIKNAVKDMDTIKKQITAKQQELIELKEYVRVRKEKVIVIVKRELKGFKR
jgi:hypothetical protein